MNDIEPAAEDIEPAPIVRRVPVMFSVSVDLLVTGPVTDAVMDKELFRQVGGSGAMVEIRDDVDGVEINLDTLDVFSDPTIEDISVVVEEVNGWRIDVNDVEV